ncbi:MAG: Sapep family Mn(2+)-dependent dipeptidase [Eubacteriales bacterium]|nr:Sapep family Mn(2+)-dependent dipeptidase [Eubacteriales bacterium]
MISILSDDNRELLTKILEGLISVPSVKSESSDKAPFGEHTAQALRFFLNVAEAYGFKVADLDGYAGYIEFGEGPREVAVLCHLDIVPPGDGWTVDPYSLNIKDGKFIGRGIIDDKGPAAACFLAMKILKDNGWKPSNRIRLILGLDEESGCECMDHYRSVEKVPDIGFTPDAKFPVIYAEKGILHVTFRTPDDSPLTSGITLSADGGDKANMVPSTCRYSLNGEEFIVHGRSSHASMPQYGINAISRAMTDISEKLKAKGLRHTFVDFYTKYIAETTDGSLIGIGFSDSQSGPLTFSVGLLSISSSSVSMTIDIRYPVTFSKESIMDRLRSAASSVGLEISEDSSMDPLYREPDSEFVQSLLDVYNSVTGESRIPIAIGGGTYARRMPNIIAFGPVFDPVRDVAHQADEYILEEELLSCIEIYRNALVRLDELLG